MFLLKNINLSKILLAVISIAFLMNVITNNTYIDILSLQAKSIFTQLSLWKLLTFPFAIHTVDSFVLFAFVFHFFAEKLENIIGSIRFGLWLLILNTIFAGILTLLFWNSNFSFSGLDSISFFVISLYLMLKPKSYIKIIKSKMYALPATLLFMMIWMSIKIMSYGLNDIEMAMSTLSSFVFGVTTSLIIYFQIRLYTKKQITQNNFVVEQRTSNETNDVEYLSAIKERNLSYLYNTDKISREAVSEVDYMENYDFAFHGISEDATVNEERLNYILDKMNDKGEASLTVSEKKFLYFYSKQL
ncbi:MAG TPA: hypothetical protein PLE30_04510 [Candidatus Kapabacteria bacterium]|nr:hypothetical protein [Candidatus Kapabacteria bacterium]